MSYGSSTYTSTKDINKGIYGAIRGVLPPTSLRKVTGNICIPIIPLLRGVLGGVRPSGNTGLPAQIEVEYKEV